MVDEPIYRKNSREWFILKEINELYKELPLASQMLDI